MAPLRSRRPVKLDVDAFRRHYLAERSLPMALAHGWRATAAREDRVRWAVDVELVDPDGRTAIAYLERRSQGGPSLAATEHLAVSYYPPPPGVDEGALSNVARDLAARLRACEATVTARDVDEIFTTAPGRDASRAAQHPVELRINRECNEACLFCNTPPDSEAILDGRPRVLAEIDRLYALGHRAVVFTGREPTLDPELEGYVRTAKARGYDEIGLQTNATAFSQPEYLARLCDAGLSRVQVSLHTFHEPTFRVLVGAGRLLEKTLQGLSNLLAVPALDVEVLCVVTALNVGELPAFTRRLCAEYARPERPWALVLSPMAPQGDGAGRLDLLASLDDLRRAVGTSLQIAVDAGVTARVPNRCGLPVCLTPGELMPHNMAAFVAPGNHHEQGKSRAPKCAACAFADRCAGTWTQYLERFGDEALSPLDELPAPLRDGDGRTASQP